MEFYVCRASIHPSDREHISPCDGAYLMAVPRTFSHTDEDHVTVEWEGVVERWMIQVEDLVEFATREGRIVLHPDTVPMTLTIYDDVIE